MLVIRGEAGIGKTTLLDYTAERSGGCEKEAAWDSLRPDVWRATRSVFRRPALLSLLSDAVEEVDATLYAEGPAPESSELMHRKQGTV